MSNIKVSTAILSALLLPAAFLHGQQGFVHTSGTEIVDGRGKPLMLRGINLGNWFEPEGYMFHFDGGPQSPREIVDLTRELIGPIEAEDFWTKWRETYITKADIDLIKAMGFNSVRVPIHWEFFQANYQGFVLLDKLVEWARKDGIYIIIDMHCAPGGQTGTNIDDSYGYPWLYTSKYAQAALNGDWQRIADHYRNEPMILGYDLLNEPIPDFPALQRYNKDLEPMYKTLAAVIRAVDRNHILILGGAQWDSNFKVLGRRSIKTSSTPSTNTGPPLTRARSRNT
jgi:endoglucanase